MNQDLSHDHDFINFLKLVSVMAVTLLVAVVVACGRPTDGGQPTGEPVAQPKVECPHLLYADGRYYNPSLVTKIHDGWIYIPDSYGLRFNEQNDELVKQWCDAMKAQAELEQSSPSSSRE